MEMENVLPPSNYYDKISVPVCIPDQKKTKNVKHFNDPDTMTHK